MEHKLLLDEQETEKGTKKDVKEEVVQVTRKETAKEVTKVTTWSLLMIFLNVKSVKLISSLPHLGVEISSFLTLEQTSELWKSLCLLL